MVSRNKAAAIHSVAIIDSFVHVGFRITCQPQHVFDGARRLVYRGQFDGSRPGNGQPVTGADLRAAVEAVLNGKPVAVKQMPSIGCNIKWRE